MLSRVVDERPACNIFTLEVSIDRKRVIGACRLNKYVKAHVLRKYMAILAKICEANN